MVSFTRLPRALVIEVSRCNGITWDAIVSCEMIGIYKPNAEAYETAARWLKLPPQAILVVACHNLDLNAAQVADTHTAFVRRPEESGPGGPPEPNPNRACDFIEDGFHGLRERVLAAS